MESYTDVIKNILELLKTIEEGIFHMEKLILKLEYEECVVMFQDVLHGIEGIETSMMPMLEKLPENNISTLMEKIYSSVENIVNIIENNQVDNLSVKIESDFMPAFLNWKIELERILSSYVVS